MNRIYTIGYEGAALPDFIETLVQSGVTLLLDVRELPMSRRRGFSKTALRQALADGQIAYRHEKMLGSPRDMRHRLRRDWDYREFFRAYRAHLQAQKPLLAQLAEELTGNVALLCYERDHRECHRSIVADALSSLAGISQYHLEVTQDASRKKHKAPDKSTRKGLSAV